MNGKLFFVIFSFFIWNLSLLFASKSLKLLTGLVSPSAMMNNQKNLLIPKHRGISTWQIPGKIKHSESNLTTSSVIRFLGVLYTHPSYGTIEYQNFGTGHVLVPYGDSYQEKNLNFPCVYMTNINSNIRKKWKPLVREDPLGVLGITIECAIPQSTEGDKFASILRLEKALTVTVSIFTPNLTNSLQDSYLLQQSEKFTPLQLPHASQYQPQYRSLPAHIHTTIKMENPTVITVQTFMNNISGPSLYMFVLYYMNLDYGIIIYDMYGLHQSYLQQFIDQEIIDYHSFTVFENIFPHVFNYQTYQKEYVSTSSYLIFLSLGVSERYEVQILAFHGYFY